MAPPSNLAVMSHDMGGIGALGGVAQHEPKNWSTQSPQMSRGSTPSMSKAERLLGVTPKETNNGPVVDHACPVHGHAATAARRKPTRRTKGFTSAIADIKGALSGATRIAAARGRRTPSSPAFLNGNDSESATSAASPTMNTSASASSVPTYTEPTPRPVYVEPPTMPTHAERSPLASYVEPSSPYRSHRGSDSPSSPMDHEALLDYHAAVASTQHKGAKGLPSISENLGASREATNGRLPARHGPSVPLMQASAAKSIPLDQIRSPSAFSAASEATATARFFGRRGNKRASREGDPDEPSNKSMERQQAGGHMPLPPMPANRGDSNAIEQWLARADLERRPSTTSTATRSTFAAARRPPGPSFSPTESSFSASTMTTQKDTLGLPRHQAPPAPKLRTVKSSDELDTFAVARQQPTTSGKAGRDLMHESMLSLSSSDEDSGDEAPIARPVRPKAERTVNTNGAATKQHPAKPFNVQPKTAPEFLQMQRQVIQQQNSQKNATKGRARQIAIPPQPEARRGPFENFDWDEESVERNAHPLRVVTATATNDAQSEVPKSSRKVDSMIISPTSKVMVVSRNEEVLLSRFRDEARGGEAEYQPENAQRSAKQKPAVSRQLPLGEDEAEHADISHRILDVSGGDVMAFPNPPTQPASDGRRDRPEPIEVSRSKDTLPDRMVLPDVGGHLNSPLLPRPGGLLSPDAASQVSPGFAVSPGTPAVGNGQGDYFAEDTTPPHLQELQGSFPDLTTALRKDIERRREKRRSPAMLYSSGLESRHGPAMEGLDDEDDVASYVRSAVI